MIETIGLLLRHVKVDGSDYALDPDSKLVDLTDENEEKLLLSETSYLVRLLLNANKTRSMNSLCKGLLHYAGGQKPRVDELYKVISFALRDFDYDRLRPYYYLFE